MLEKFMIRQVACSEFVKRQTPDSGFSHFNGTWEDLELLVEWYMNDPNNVKPGYKDGVILVQLPAIIPDNGLCQGCFKFYSGTVSLNENTKLFSTYAPRIIGEAPYIKTAAKAKKQLANHVEIICYRADVLAEDNDRSTDANWEIICIKARVSDEEEPMDPYTMARNFLHMKGGTKAEFTAEQFAKSIVYWNNHTHCLGKKTIWTILKAWLKRIFFICTK
jgi:hypothetical protein